MKYYITLVFAFLLVSTYSQKSNSWVSIQDTVYNIEFLMPETPIVVDTLNSKLYSVALDSTLGLDVHIYDTAVFNVNDIVFNQVLIDENNDTLRTIAILILFATNSEVTQIVEVETNGIDGLEIGISYKTLASEIPLHTFIRYYLHKNRFISFSVSSVESDMMRAVSTKDQFYESINIE